MSEPNDGQVDDEFDEDDYEDVEVVEFNDYDEDKNENEDDEDDDEEDEDDGDADDEDDEDDELTNDDVPAALTWLQQLLGLGERRCVDNDQRALVLAEARVLCSFAASNRNMNRVWSSPKRQTCAKRIRKRSGRQTLLTTCAGVCVCVMQKDCPCMKKDRALYATRESLCKARF